jgi:hypothetical protein
MRRQWCATEAASCAALLAHLRTSLTQVARVETFGKRNSRALGTRWPQLAAGAQGGAQTLSQR